MEQASSVCANEWGKMIPGKIGGKGKRKGEGEREKKEWWGERKKGQQREEQGREGKEIEWKGRKTFFLGEERR